MKSIYKYSCDVADEVVIEMPAGAEVLCVQVQGEEGPKIWAQVNLNETEVDKRVFHWRCTGQPTPVISERYVGTVQTRGGMLVFHLFEATPWKKPGAPI